MNNYEFDIHYLFILYLGFTFAQAVTKNPYNTNNSNSLV